MDEPFRAGEPLVLTPAQAQTALQCGPTRLWDLINTGEVESFLDGNRRRITAVIDVDGPEGDKRLALLEEKFGELPATSESSSGNGRHLWYALPDGCGPVPSSTGNGLDIRGDGGYVIAPRSVHPNGKTYEWDEKSPRQFAEAPEWLLDVVKNWKAEIEALGRLDTADGSRGGHGGGRPLSKGGPTPRLGRANGGPRPFDEFAPASAPEPWSEIGEARLRSALTAIPAFDRDTWLKIGFALHDLIVGGSRLPGREMWDEWSRTCPAKFDLAGQDKAWESFGRNYDRERVTVATVYHSAKEQGWVDLVGPLGRMPNETARKCADATQARPIIRVAGGDLSREADEAEQAVIGSGLPIFVRAGVLVSPVCEEAPAAKNRTTTIARLRRLTVDGIIDRLSRYADFQRYDARAKKWLSIDPPERVAKIILARAGVGKFPQVAGMITTPTLRPDGSVLAEPGYDPSTRLYLALDDNFAMPAIPVSPTHADALEALALLGDLLSGFPFVAPSIAPSPFPGS